MSYDYNYFSGNDLTYPVRPRKPVLQANATSADALVYANELAAYEAAMVDYNAARESYNVASGARMLEFKARVKSDYRLNDAEFDVLWSRAWEDGHAYGLSEVISHFDDYYDMAMAFVKAKT